MAGGQPQVEEMERLGRTNLSVDSPYVAGKRQRRLGSGISGASRMRMILTGVHAVEISC